MLHIRRHRRPSNARNARLHPRRYPAREHHPARRLSLRLLERAHRRCQSARPDHALCRLTMGRHAGIHRHRVAAYAMRAHHPSDRCGVRRVPEQGGRTVTPGMFLSPSFPAKAGSRQAEGGEDVNRAEANHSSLGRKLSNILCRQR